MKERERCHGRQRRGPCGPAADRAGARSAASACSMGSPSGAGPQGWPATRARGDAGVPAGHSPLGRPGLDDQMPDRGRLRACARAGGRGPTGPAGSARRPTASSRPRRPADRGRAAHLVDRRHRSLPSGRPGWTRGCRCVGGVVPVAPGVAVGADSGGRREGAGHRSLRGRDLPDGLCAPAAAPGVKLVVPDAQEGSKTAARILCTTRRRCRGHFTRNALARAGRSGQHVVPACIATAVAQGRRPDGQDAVAPRCRPAPPPEVRKLVTSMDGSEPDVPACMTFPARPRTQPSREPARTAARRDQATDRGPPPVSGQAGPTTGPASLPTRPPPRARSGPSRAERRAGRPASPLHDP